MHKRNLRLLSALVALGLLTAACGNDDDEGSGDTTTTTAPDEGGGSDDGLIVDGQLSLDAACEQAKEAGVEAPDDFTVRLVTDIGRVNDGTFNQYAYEGLQAAAECFDFETSYIETVAEADYEKNINTALEGDPAMVITVGFLITDATKAAAEANPEVSFVGVDQFLPEFPANMVGLQYNEHEGGYLAGVLAASLTETQTIGVVGGLESVPPVVKLVNGYEAGAKSVNPDINVLKIYNDSFYTPDKGASDAQQFIGEGADVIFGAGGPTGSGGVKAATAQGLWGIGVDQDEYFTTFNGGKAPGADKLASSAVKRVDYGVFAQIVNLLKDEFEGGTFVLTAENGGITYAPFHDAEIPDDVATLLEETRQGLADGSIDTGLDPITGLPK